MAISESTSRLASSSIRDGLLTIQDANGNPIALFGRLADGSYGVLVRTANGAFTLAQLTSNGWQAPHLAAPSYDPAASKSVNVASLHDDMGHDLRRRARRRPSRSWCRGRPTPGRAAR